MIHDKELERIWAAADEGARFRAMVDARLVLANLVHYRSDGAHYLDDQIYLGARLLQAKQQPSLEAQDDRQNQPER